jgi:hypothetical protein
MRISRGVTALAAASLLAATITGAAARAATNTAGSCTPSWKLVSAPAGPAAGQQGQITGLAVDRAGDAWFPATIAGGEGPLAWAYHWNGHSFGATSTLPQGSYTSRSSASDEPFGGPWVGPVSFDSRSDGWLVGGTSLLSIYSQQYAAHWSGGRWTMVPLPVGSNARTDTLGLMAVAAVSPADAWAVGYDLPGSAPARALIEHWDGTQWSIVPNPAARKQGAFLDAITALSPADIWAVGLQTGAGGTIRPLTEHWDGTSWTVVPAPAAAAPSRFIAVSADGPSDVWAVGSQLQKGTSDSATALVEHWNGQAWSVVRGLPDLGNGELLAVYAASPADVWATVWAPETNGGLGVDEFVHWNGSKWTTVPVPGPQEYGDQTVYTGLAGTGPGNLWAAGSVTNPADGQTPLIAHLTCG